MTAILRNESRRLIRSSLILTGAFVLLTAFMLAVFPAMQAEAEMLEEAFPDYLLGLFGLADMHTIEGFTGGYVYSLIWVVFVAVYFAYASAGLIAGDIRTRRMDLTLSNPVSRESVVLQKFASLWVPLLVFNVGVLGTVFVGAQMLGESLDPVAMTMLHLLSVPYLLVCAGIGLVLSVVLDRVGTAQVTALGLVFVLWLAEGLSENVTNFEWVGALTPQHYYDPSAILLTEEYALFDAFVLVLTALGLVALATLIFVRRDI